MSGSNVLLGWQLAAPGGALLFDSVLLDHQLTLPQTGVYTLTVAGNGVDDFGTYAFTLREAVTETWQFFCPWRQLRRRRGSWHAEAPCSSTPASRTGSNAAANCLLCSVMI